MINPNLQPYFNVFKYFLNKVSDVTDCVLEFAKTQEYIADLTKIRHQHDAEFKRLDLKVRIEIGKIREATINRITKRGQRVTSEMIVSFTDANLPEDLQKDIQAMDYHKSNYDTANTLVMAMMQRKDIISEAINHIKYSKDFDSCLMKNKHLLKKLGIILENEA